MGMRKFLASRVSPIAGPQVRLVFEQRSGGVPLVTSVLDTLAGGMTERTELLEPHRPSHNYMIVCMQEWDRHRVVRAVELLVSEVDSLTCGLQEWDRQRVVRGVELLVSEIDSLTCCFPLEAPVVSEAQHLALEVPAVREHEVPSVLTEVSEDLLILLGRGLRVEGKHYEENIESLLGERPEPVQRDHRAYREKKNAGVLGNVTERETVTIWDMIFPLLQPPLDIASPGFALPAPLRPYQYRGVEFMLSPAEGALLADDMGTGKTVITTVALKLLFQTGGARKALVLCPVAALQVWMTHLNDWAPELRYTWARGSQDRRRIDWRMPAHVYVATYDVFRNDVLSDRPLLDSNALQSFDVVVADEAQAIKNRASKRARAVKRVNGAICRWALTGTPIENKLEDLVSIFDFVEPDLLYEEAGEDEVRELIAPHFLRRTKSEVLPDLPEKISQEIWLDLDPDQQREYDAAEESARRGLIKLGDKVSHVSVFAAITKLKLICNFATGTSTGPKIRALRELAEAIVEGGGKLVVFSQWIEKGFEKIKAELDEFGVASIRGGDSPAKRKQAVKDFMDDPNTRIFVGSTRASGLGIDLTSANYVVHFDHWWNPATMRQAEDRVHRYGQNKTVNVYSYWMLNTIEEKISNLLAEKRGLFERMIDSLAENVVETSISTEEWLEEVFGIKRDFTHKKASVTEEPLTVAAADMLDKLTPLRFEEVTRCLFEKMYYAANCTPATRDGGIDVVATASVPGGTERYAIQCKHMRMVGVDAARGLLGAISQGREFVKGFLVTTGQASKDCRAFCSRNPRLALIEGPLLRKYLAQFGVKIPGEQSE